ncbi:AAA family ATPase [Carnobacterium maltaromaticum]|uniref:McrB family protein n=1 Tax=Carnobacterium maltaromaticum TaxID=2751 RepID=UPI00298B249F|nr:AAA family ATPase [Carnobacterium maltaromaticum]MDW5524075.1 AAA family ATPase [Carnobacterium maltaromaticum]
MDFKDTGNEYKEFKYLLKRFVEQANINIKNNENRETSIGIEGFENNKFSRVKNYDVLNIAGIDYHIHLFSSGSYGPTKGEGSSKVPYFDYGLPNGNWANVRTTFQNFEISSLRIVEWNKEKNRDKELGISYKIAELDLFSKEEPNKTLIRFYEDFVNVGKKESSMEFTNKKKELAYKLEKSKNIILRGAPGTGKSYLAKEIAAEIIGISKEELKDSEQFEFVQFHPSYDYTDFVEGLRPVTPDDGEIGFELQDGIFKSFCGKAIEALRIGGKDNFEESWAKYLAHVNTADEKEYVTKTAYLTVNSVNNFNVTYDSGANGGVLPKRYVYELYKNPDYKKQLYYRGQALVVIEKMKKKFGLVSYLAPAESNSVEGKKFVFVIDEINRGEISKILGELFFSIDPSYRGKSGSVKTQYANLRQDDENFYIPENVYIIGTMNDIDRSVDSFDFAMRRRFRFIEIKANETLSMWQGQLDDDKIEDAADRLISLNEQISVIDDLNSNYHIGPSYFLKLPELDYSYEVLWQDYLQPLLEEYIRGSYEEKQKIESMKDAYNLINKIDEVNYNEDPR